MNLVDVVKKAKLNPKVNDFPSFRAGDTIAVHAKIKEGNKERIQVFQGTCISVRRRNDLEGHFRVRKVSSGVGVERVFPFHSPNVDKVVLVGRGKTRRSKLYYLRDRTGKRARVAMQYEKKKTSPTGDGQSSES